jgi:hypothetical protein
MRFPLLGFAGLSVALCAAPALADHRIDAPQLKQSLRIGVQGVVPADCQLSQSQHDFTIEGFQNPQTDTVQRTSAKLPFTVSCNTPVSVTLDSRSGGLKFAGSGTSDRAFATLIPYLAKVHLPSRGAVLSCRSGEMANQNGCQTTVEATMIDGEGSIEVAVPASNKLVLAGQYQDQVTITLTPALGGCLT